MKVLILTQNDNLYLPAAMARVCRGLGERVTAIVAAPALSTHGGAWRGLTRHAGLFGVAGTVRLAWRVLVARVRDRVGPRCTPAGPFHSLRRVAEAFDVPYRYVEKVNSEAFRRIARDSGAELLISMSCPQIIRDNVRACFPAGCINVHGSPLPRYRGLMPAFWTLRHSEPATAATVHVLDSRLDNGDILLQRPVPIVPDDTWDSLVRKTKRIGADALVEVVRQIEAGTVQPQPNRDDEASYFTFPAPADRDAFLAAGRNFF